MLMLDEQHMQAETPAATKNDYDYCCLHAAAFWRSKRWFHRTLTCKRCDVNTKTDRSDQYRGANASNYRPTYPRFSGAASSGRYNAVVAVAVPGHKLVTSGKRFNAAVSAAWLAGPVLSVVSQLVWRRRWGVSGGRCRRADSQKDRGLAASLQPGWSSTAN